MVRLYGRNYSVISEKSKSSTLRFYATIESRYGGNRFTVVVRIRNGNFFVAPTVDKIKTTPYHPECNGVVERMHGTLGAMLTKASSLGLDWVGQLPFAMFALRSAPNRDTMFSPFQLVYGHQVRTPLDILHQGWAELSFKELDTSEWSSWLADRLEAWHDVLRERGRDASGKRKELFR